MKRWVVAPLVLSILLIGCGDSEDNADEQKILTVYAAASLTDAFTQIGEDFEAANDDVEVRFNFGGSSQLAAQINNGAPGDVFASANVTQMMVVEEAGNLDSELQHFATNSLVVIVSTSSDEEIDALSDLQNDGVMFITAVDGVPIREYTNTVLDNLSTANVYGEGYSAAVFENLVSEESNVRQVVVKVSLGEADAAIVYASDVTPDVADSLTVIPIPVEYNVVVTYPIAVLKQSEDKDLAQRFVTFVLAADTTLTEWGLQPVE